MTRPLFACAALPVLSLVAGADRLKGGGVRRRLAPGLHAPAIAITNQHHLDLGDNATTTINNEDQLIDAITMSSTRRGLLEEVEKVRVKFQYMFFADADFTELAPPTDEIFQGLACQTDAYLTGLLQDRLQTTARVSLHVTEWSYDPTQPRPLELSFQVEAMYDDAFIFDKRIKAVEVVETVRKAVFEDYISKFVWQTYPLVGKAADIVRNINRLSFDAQATFVPAEIATANVLFDTKICRASTKVRSAWHFGFFDGILEDPATSQPNQMDMEAVACQIRTFLENYVSGENFGAAVTVDLRHLDWTYDTSKEEAVTILLDMRATIQHANREERIVPAQTLLNMAKQADIRAFILEHVHKTQTEAEVAAGEKSVFLNVQRVNIDSIALDVAPGDEDTSSGIRSTEWNSDQCPQYGPTAAPTIAPAPTLAPTKNENVVTLAPSGAGEGSVTPLPTSEPQSAAGDSGAVTNTIPTGAPANIFAHTDNEFLGWCRLALIASDGDRSRRLNAQEYVNLLNTVGEGVFEGYPFLALPFSLKTNYDAWTSSASGEIDLEAELMPSENTNGIDTSEMALWERQEARQDAICGTTEEALFAAAADTDSLQPVRLDITTTFLAKNQAGINGTDDFWASSADLQPAFASFLITHVMNAIEEKLMSPAEEERQLRGRRLDTDTAGDQYWVLPETTDLFQVQGTRCPLESPEGESCLIATTTYEIFVLTHNISDSLNSDAIAAAAQNATEVGIADGSLQESLELANPSTVWTLKTDPTTRSIKTTTPMVAAEEFLTQAPTMVSGRDGQPSETFIFVEDEDTGDEVETVNATKILTKSQCGGDLGLQALEFMNTECDSFAGRHIWTIFALSFLFGVLLCLFMPILVCGGYPCCGRKKADKISSGATRCTASVVGPAGRAQPKRGGRRPKVKRENSGLSSISSGFGERMDRRSKMKRSNSGRSIVSDISSGFSAFSGFGGGPKRNPRRGRRPDMTRENSGLSALSDGFDDEAMARKFKKQGGNHKEETGSHAEPWFYPQPDQAKNGATLKGSNRSRAQSCDSGVSVDIQSTDAYIGQNSAPPRRGRKKDPAGAPKKAARSTDPKQAGRPVDPKKASRPVDPKKTARPIDLKQAARSADPKKAARPIDPKHSARPTTPKQAARPTRRPLQRAKSDASAYSGVSRETNVAPPTGAAKKIARPTTPIKTTRPTRRTPKRAKSNDSGYSGVPQGGPSAAPPTGAASKRRPIRRSKSADTAYSSAY